MSAVAAKTIRSARLGSRAAEQTLLDQQLFMVSGAQYQAFVDLLAQPEQPNLGLHALFSRKAPWVGSALAQTDF